jgi:uncharacterized protein with HEPN domain
MAEKKKPKNVIQIVQSNIKDIDYRDLEKIRDIMRDELFNRDMTLIQENCSANLKRLEKGLNEVIKKEINKQLRSSRVDYNPENH